MSVELLTPEYIAKELHVSYQTVMRRFENRPGVIDIGTPETRFKRRYRVLRIPRECFEEYLHEKTNRGKR
jgi:hypothetical protein